MSSAPQALSTGTWKAQNFNDNDPLDTGEAKGSVGMKLIFFYKQ